MQPELIDWSGKFVARLVIADFQTDLVYLELVSITAVSEIII